MVLQYEFKLLQQLKLDPFLKREQFDSDEDFDYACEVARALMTYGLLHSSQKNSFQKSHTGRGSTYAIAGKFELSSEALDITHFKDFESYEQAQPKEGTWNWDRRLAALTALIMLVGVIVTIWSVWVRT